MFRIGLRRLMFLTLSVALLCACGKVGHRMPKESAPPIVFQQGKDYEVIPNSGIIPRMGPKVKIRVVEFFSYGCQACFHFDSILNDWAAKRPYVLLERIPVVSQSDERWNSLARLYYIAKMLGVEEQLRKPLFEAIHTEGKDLSDPKLQREFFVQHGINEDRFNDIARFNPGISQQLLESDTLIKKDKVIAVPTLVVEGQYKVDPRMVGGNPKLFLAVVDQLVDKLRKGLGN